MMRATWLVVFLMLGCAREPAPGRLVILVEPELGTSGAAATLDFGDLHASRASAVILRNEGAQTLSVARVDFEGEAAASGASFVVPVEPFTHPANSSASK